MRNPNEGPWHQEVHAFGLNYRLPDILCALGLSQISRITDFKAQRNRIFDNYTEAFQENLQIQLPTKPDSLPTLWRSGLNLLRADQHDGNNAHGQRGNRHNDKLHHLGEHH